jgi:glycosyltransferase involved in cell wall biosynthesis
MSDYKIGIVTANYNGGKYFEGYLEGLLSQTVIPNYVVIVDDGSKDDSYKEMIEKLETICKNYYEKEDPDGNKIFKGNYKETVFIVFGQKENKGPAAARNVALNFLVDKTDIIFIYDSDDIYKPTKIEKSLEVFKAYPEVALVYSDYDVLVSKSGKRTREYKEPFSFKRLFNECIVSNNSAIATRILNTIGGYDESLFGPEDYDLWLRIAEVGAVYHIPESLYTYRITGNNITVTTPSEKFAQHVRRVHEKAIERRNGK